MAKHKDKLKFGSSKEVPHIDGEAAMVRHDRRKDAFTNCRGQFEKFCVHQGFKLKIHNDDHHWQISHGKTLIEFWPSSAKLIINKQWKSGIHVHDYKQLTTILNIVKLTKTGANG